MEIKPYHNKFVDYHASDIFQVVAREVLYLTSLPNVEFWIYLHDKGEEYYLHYDLWPTVPPIYHVRKPEALLDLVIKKELKISSDDCKDGDYSYFGMYLYKCLFHQKLMPL